MMLDGKEKNLNLCCPLRRAPYEIGEEIRGILRKILQTKHNKMGRKKRPYIHQLCRNMINPYSTTFLFLF